MFYIFSGSVFAFSFPDYFSVRPIDANKMAAKRDALLSLCAS